MSTCYNYSIVLDSELNESSDCSSIFFILFSYIFSISAISFLSYWFYISSVSNFSWVGTCYKKPCNYSFVAYWWNLRSSFKSFSSISSCVLSVFLRFIWRCSYALKLSTSSFLPTANLRSWCVANISLSYWVFFAIKYSKIS